MNLGTTFESRPLLRSASRGAEGLIGLLLITAALSAAAGAAAMWLLDHVSAAWTLPQQVPVHAAWPATAQGRDPSVPDAGSVLFGRDLPPEEPTPTF